MLFSLMSQDAKKLSWYAHGVAGLVLSMGSRGLLKIKRSQPSAAPTGVVFMPNG
jgi:hypothetical protein